MAGRGFKGFSIKPKEDNENDKTQSNSSNISLPMSRVGGRGRGLQFGLGRGISSSSQLTSTLSYNKLEETENTTTASELDLKGKREDMSTSVAESIDSTASSSVQNFSRGRGYRRGVSTLSQQRFHSTTISNQNENGSQTTLDEPTGSNDDFRSLGASSSKLSYAPRGRGISSFGFQRMLPKENAASESTEVSSVVELDSLKLEETTLSDDSFAKGSVISFAESASSVLSKVSSIVVPRGRGMLSMSSLSVATSRTQSNVSTIQHKDSNSGTLERALSTEREKFSKPSTSLGSGTTSIDSSINEIAPTKTGAIPEVTRVEPVEQNLIPALGEEPVVHHGTAGTKFTAMTNSIKINCDPNMGVFEYQVNFIPTVDNVHFRSKYLRQHKDALGINHHGHVFDGNNLAIPSRLPNDFTVLTTKSFADESEIKIEILYKRKRRVSENVQLFNNIFEKIFNALEYLRVGKKSYNPRAPQLIERLKLELWPGYVKSVDELEDGLFLTLDVSSRILQSRTVLAEMMDAYRSNKEGYKELVTKALIGKIVLTRYNNMSYRIDDIAFDKTPNSTFTRGEVEISYSDYYKQQYNIDIKDFKQPLLVSRKQVRISGEPEKREYTFLLVPELCYLTGLSDPQKNNFHVLKEIASFTKLQPFQRVASYKTFLANVNNTPEAKIFLSSWGLSIESDPTKVEARLLSEERIIFARSKEFGVGQFADFSRHATTNEVLEPMTIEKWLLVYVKKANSTEAKKFEEMLMMVCGPTGIKVSPSRRIELANDRNQTFVDEITRALKSDNYQIVVVIVPSLREDRYAAIKNLMCVTIPIPSQVIQSKTLKNDAKNRSIVQKIILQMNCKMGGTLWGIKIPLKKTMICGIDTFHSTTINVGAFTASLDPGFTHWFNASTIQKRSEELVNGLTSSVISALKTYYNRNAFYPESIIVYRDGVGDGQLATVKSYEIPQLKEAFKQIGNDYSPKLTFVVVQKRINHKLFQLIPGKAAAASLINPPPGAVLDHTVTSRALYDFLLITQHVREGATTPTRFIVLTDERAFAPDVLQKLTYKLCFLYYNWPGTVRVPAPCQYAHKLATLVGESIHREPSKELDQKLFFL